MYVNIDFVYRCDSKKYTLTVFYLTCFLLDEVFHRKSGYTRIFN